MGWHGGANRRVIQPAKVAAVHPTSPPERAPTAAQLRAPRAPRRAPLTDRLVYRWERLREDQRRRAWGMVEQMRLTVAREHRRRRRRERTYALLIVLVIAADAALVYLVLHGVVL